MRAIRINIVAKLQALHHVSQSYLAVPQGAELLIADYYFHNNWIES